jgi:hypothetical protein
VSHDAETRASARRITAALLAAVSLHLALAVATGSTWNHQHDEALTYDKAGKAWQVKTAPDVDWTVAELLPQVDGSELRSPPEVVHGLASSAHMPHPPAFYLLWNAWAHLAGTGTVVTRIPQYALGALLVFGLAVLARRMVPHPWAGAWVALLAGSNPWLLELVNFLRPYTLALCAAVWATVFALRAMGPERRHRDLAAFVLASLLGLYTVYHYVFVLAWHMALIALACWRAGGLRGLRTPALTATAIAVGYAPWIPVFLFHAADTSSSERFFAGVVPLGEWPLRVGLMLERYAVGQEFPVPHLAWILGLATLALVVPAFRRSAAPDRIGSLAWGTALLLPALMQLADLWMGTATLVVSKYSFVLFPLLLLVVVRAWCSGTGGRATHYGLALTWLLFLAAGLHAMVHAANRPAPVRAIARELVKEDRPGHLVVSSRATSGHVAPLLLEFRELAVSEVRLRFCHTEELLDSMHDAFGSGEFDRITLINFVIGKQRRDSRWSSEVLAKVRALARDQEWEQRRGPADVLAELWLAGERVLTIVSPVRARTYHRPRIGVASGREAYQPEPGDVPKSRSPGRTDGE